MQHVGDERDSDADVDPQDDLVHQRQVRDAWEAGRGHELVGHDAEDRRGRLPLPLGQHVACQPEGRPGHRGDDGQRQQDLPQVKADLAADFDLRDQALGVAFVLESGVKAQGVPLRNLEARVEPDAVGGLGDYQLVLPPANVFPSHCNNEVLLAVCLMILGFLIVFSLGFYSKRKKKI